MNAKKFHNFYMEVARITATLSYARKRKVGAIIVKEGNILSFGYNGMPSGMSNEAEIELPDQTLKTKPEVLHAESNAILKAAKTGFSVRDSTIYTTTAPCLECAKLIIQAGIGFIVYDEIYKTEEGIGLLKQRFIPVKQIQEL